MGFDSTSTNAPTAKSSAVDDRITSRISSNDTATSPDDDETAPKGLAMPKKTMTRAQLAERIAQGETLVLHRQRVYKLDAWLPRHPGGDLAILHFVGRDATDEIEAYHADETLARMRAFCIAMLDKADWQGVKGEGYKPLVPPVQLGYRSGKLDHPDAQWAAWKAAKTDEAIGSSSSMATPSSRPKGFPLPVTLLEPPPDPAGIDPVRERGISQDYKRMQKQLKEAGLYDLRPSAYAYECVRYIALGLIAAWTWKNEWYITSSFFLGMCWHQLTFTAHDAGHTGITHNHFVDRLIGTVIADYLGGLSIGWWCDSHDVHHLVTNHPEHDPDIQHLPFFAVSPKFLVRESPSGETKGQIGLWSSYYRRIVAFDAPSRFLLTVQHKVYYIVMSLGRFNLYANSYGFLAFKARRDKWLYIETVGLVLFWYWFGYLYLLGMPSWTTRIAALLISHIVTSPLHIQIVLSHFARSSEDLGLHECFASRQVRTTMDVLCPTYLDFFHGGLQMQVSHHLFPRMPRHNLREVRDRFVRPFAEKWNMPYEEFTFIKGNGKVLRTLEDVANQVKVLALVAQAQAKGELHH